MLATACVATMSPVTPSADPAHVVQVDEHERDDHPVPEGVHEPAHLQREDGARKRREVRPEEAAHRGTLATACVTGFLLDPEVAYFNHGSYGACPVEVFDEYQRLAARARARADGLLRAALRRRDARARARRSPRSSARAPTTSSSFRTRPPALNAVIRSLRIRPEEEILTTKHEYGAILRTLGFVRRERRRSSEPEELIARIGIRTRVVLVSHITSPTALVLPVEEICEAAREGGRPLDRRRRARARAAAARRRRQSAPTSTRGTATSGSARRRASGFLWARPGAPGVDRAARDQLGLPRGRGLRRAPRLAGDARSVRVPRRPEGDRGARDVRPRADARISQTRPKTRLATLGCARVAARPAPFMRAIELHRATRTSSRSGSTASTGVEVPVYEWGGRRILRVSVGPYNDEGDLERLEQALRALV